MPDFYPIRIYRYRGYSITSSINFFSAAVLRRDRVFGLSGKKIDDYHDVAGLSSLILAVHSWKPFSLFCL